MTGDAPEWVKVGQEVVSRYQDWSGLPQFGRPKKIAKVYKTGRFVLEDDDQQYRAASDGERAIESRRSRWLTVLVPLTEAVRAEMREADETRRRREICAAVSKNLHNKQTISDELFAAISAVEKLLTTEASNDR